MHIIAYAYAIAYACAIAHALAYAFASAYAILRSNAYACAYALLRTPSYFHLRVALMRYIATILTNIFHLPGSEPAKITKLPELPNFPSIYPRETPLPSPTPLFSVTLLPLFGGVEMLKSMKFSLISPPPLAQLPKRP